MLFTAEPCQHSASKVCAQKLGFRPYAVCAEPHQHPDADIGQLEVKLPGVLQSVKTKGGEDAKAAAPRPAAHFRACRVFRA